MFRAQQLVNRVLSATTGTLSLAGRIRLATNSGGLRHARKYYKFRMSGAIGTYGVGINDNNNIVGFNQRSLKTYYRALLGSY
jgi:hypothetical protein